MPETESFPPPSPSSAVEIMGNPEISATQAYQMTLTELNHVAVQAPALIEDKVALQENCINFVQTNAERTQVAFNAVLEETPEADRLALVAQHVNDLYDTTQVVDRAYKSFDTHRNLGARGLYPVSNEIGELLPNYADSLDDTTFAKAMDMAINYASTGFDLGKFAPVFNERRQRAGAKVANGDSAALDIMNQTVERPQYMGMVVAEKFFPEGAEITYRPKLLLSAPKYRDDLENLVATQGIDALGAEKIVEAWSSISGHVNEDGTTRHRDGWEAIARSLETIAYLSQEVPGLPQKLQTKRGIAHFGRWPVDVLATQFDPIPDGKELYVIGASTDDHNSAFAQTGQTLGFHKVIKYAPQVKIFEATSKIQAGRQLIGIRNTYGEAETLFIMGHGSEDGVRLGPDNVDSQYLSSKEMATASFVARDAYKRNRPGKPDKNIVKPDGKQVIVACSTGSDGGFVEVVAEASGRITEGPKTPDNGHFIDKDGKLEIEFNGGEQNQATVVPRVLAATAIKYANTDSQGK